MKREELRTPCYVIMESEMKKNLQILQEIRQQSGCKILLAQKAFSMYSCYPLIGEYLDGTTASGLYEAKLGKECMGKENHIFSPAYREDEFEEVLESCEHLVFNSFSTALSVSENVTAKPEKCGDPCNTDVPRRESMRFMILVHRAPVLGFWYPNFRKHCYLT